MGVLALSGCAGPIADRIIAAPGAGIAGDALGPLVAAAPQTLAGETRTVALDGDELVYIAVPTRPFRIQLRASNVHRPDGPDDLMSAEFGWFVSREGAAPERAAVGTVVVVPGHGAIKEMLLPIAGLFADAGFDVALVDLPGHGESGGDLVTFGIREAPALNAVRRDIENRGASRPIVGYGISLGASSLIRAAAIEAGWDGVIAHSPFDAPAEVIPNFRALAPGWLRWYATPTRLKRALELAESRGGFRFDDARVSPLLDDYAVPTLIEHGNRDRLVPPEQSVRIAAAAPDSIRRVLDDGDHLDFAFRLWDRCPVMFDWLETTFSVKNLHRACERIEYEMPEDIMQSLTGITRE